MKNNPLVSIITPCYNSAGYLKRYLINILNQTYPNIELIIINDGSVDDTENIVLSYVNKFQEKGYSLIYVSQENQGLGGAINTGLKYIKGEYFTWCDSDNFYTKNYIETKIDFFLKNPQYSIVRCDGFIVLESNTHKPIGLMATGNRDKFQPKMFEYCLNVKNFHFGCAMLRTCDFDKINPMREIYPSRHGQNWQLLLPMFYHYLSGYIDEPMFYFVYRSNSVSNCVKNQNKEKRYEQQAEYYKIIIETLKTMNIKEYEKYEKVARKNYIKNCLYVAMETRDVPRLKLEYKKLKKEKLTSAKIRLVYFRGRSRLVDFFWRVVQKIKSFSVKVKLGKLSKKKCEK